MVLFIPGIAILIIMILFVKFYDLKPQKVKSNQDQLVVKEIKGNFENGFLKPSQITN